MLGEISDDHRGHARDLGHVRDHDHRGSDHDLGLYPDPSGGHAQAAPDCLPNSLQRTVGRRDAVLSIEHRHTVARSNTLRANGNACQLDTNTRRSTHTQSRDLKA